MSEPLWAKKMKMAGYPCEWCAKGELPQFLDEHGTLTHISGEPGVPMHAHDDYFWLCPNWNRCAPSPVALRP